MYAYLTVSADNADMYISISCMSVSIGTRKLSKDTGTCMTKKRTNSTIKWSWCRKKAILSVYKEDIISHLSKR